MAAPDKPGIGPTPRADAAAWAFLDQIRTCLEILMGRRAGKVATLRRNLTGTLNSSQIGAAPTQSDYNNLQTDMENAQDDIEALKDKVNEIINRLQD